MCDERVERASKGVMRVREYKSARAREEQVECLDDELLVWWHERH